MTRDELAEQTIKYAKSQGMSWEETQPKLRSVLNSYDAKQTAMRTMGIDEERASSIQRGQQYVQDKKASGEKLTTAENVMGYRMRNVGKEPTKLEKTALKVGNAAPGVASTITSMIMGLPGGKSGRAAGAFVGEAAGTAFKEKIQDTTGYQDQLPGEAVKEMMVNSAVKGGTSYAVDTALEGLGKLLKPVKNWASNKVVGPLKEKVGKTELSRAIHANAKLAQEADNVGINMVDSIKEAGLTPDDYTKKEVVREATDELGNKFKIKSIIFKGSEKVNNQINQIDDILFENAKKGGNRKIVGINQVNGAMDDIVAGNTNTAQEAKNVTKYVKEAIKKTFKNKTTTGSSATSAEAIDAARELWKQSEQASGAKKLALQKASMLLKNSVKTSVEGATELIAKQQEKIFLLEKIIPRIGQTIFLNKSNAVVGASSASSAIGQAAFRTVPGAAAGNVPGAVVGAATTLPSIAEKVFGPVNIANEALKEGGNKALGNFLKGVGAAGSTATSQYVGEKLKK